VRDLLPEDPRLAAVALGREALSAPLVGWVRSGLWWVVWLLLPLAFAANWEELLQSAPAIRSSEEPVLGLFVRTIPLVLSFLGKSLLWWLLWAITPLTGWVFITIGLAIWGDLQKSGTTE
jgi:hypothetical protein